MLPLITEPLQLKAVLDEPDLLIVDLCNFDSYSLGHIPRAIHVHPSELISGIKPATGKLPSSDRLSALFSRIGLKKDSHVIAYDDEGGGWAGRFLWTLEVIQHFNYSYLNGGLISWKEDIGELESDVNNPNLLFHRRTFESQD